MVMVHHLEIVVWIPQFIARVVYVVFVYASHEVTHGVRGKKNLHALLCL
jgi:hypothetical protein